MTLSKRTSHRKAVEIESVNKMGHDAPIEQVTSIEDTSIHFTKATGIPGHTANLHHSHPKTNQASGQLFFSLHSNISSVSRDGEFDYAPWPICTFIDLFIFYTRNI